MTDSASWYKFMNRDGYYLSQDRIDHTKGEYGRHEPGKPYITTNTVEGYFSLFKRGMRGIYQHCAEKPLHRYLAEFDFRYNARVALGIDDEPRAPKALIGAKGKRLTYRTTGGTGPSTRPAAPQASGKGGSAKGASRCRRRRNLNLRQPSRSNCSARLRRRLARRRRKKSSSELSRGSLLRGSARRKPECCDVDRQIFKRAAQD